jgi:hypothetical protein
MTITQYTDGFCCADHTALPFHRIILADRATTSIFLLQRASRMRQECGTHDHDIANTESCTTTFAKWLWLRLTGYYG